jgi:hypothetical protein
MPIRNSLILLLLAALGGALGCEETLTGPEPSLQGPVAGQPLPVDPGVICRVQNPAEGNPIVVTGERLAPSPFDVPGDPKAALPTLELIRSTDLDGTAASGATTTFGGQPGQANAELLTWQSQSQMTFHVTDGLALERGVFDVRITNPQDATTTSVGALAVIDKPTVEAATPGIVCVAQADRVITLTGQEILRVGDLSAQAIIGDKTYAVDALSDCTAIAHAGLDAELCATATVTIPAGDLTAAAHAVAFQNPETAACKSAPEEDNVNLLVVNPPEITGAQPPLICTDEMERELTLLGTNFFTVDGALPTVSVAGGAVTVDSVGGCTAVEVVGLTVENCTELNIRVAQGALSEGNPEIIVENPGPIGCSTSSATALVIPPAVTITSIDPTSICNASAGQETLTINGLGFLTIDGTLPAVTFDGADVIPSSTDGCTSIVVDGLAVEACTSLTISVDLTGAAIGTKAVTVTNPAPSGCGAEAADLFYVSGPPTIQSVQPTNICSDVTEMITVTGTGFTPGATVTVGTATADIAVVSADGSTITATFTVGISAGLYDVTVDNGVGCSSTLAAALTVDPTPIVFFVDPPVVYNAVDFEVTIFTSGLGQDAQSLTLIDSMGNRTAITAFASPTRPNRILATIPAGLTADLYEVEVTSAVGCISINNGSLRITDNVALTGLAVDPSYASPSKPTAVTISVDVATPFISTPRAYLNPNPAGAGVTATALRAVVYQNATTLTAVVPGGLTPGQYDLTVVNPDGAVGFATQAVTVTAIEPPVISDVQPQTFANNSDYPAELRGLNFDATNGVTVAITCENPTSGATTTLPVTVGATTATLVNVVLPTSQFTKGSVCLLTATNADGASFTFSAISITNSSFNLEPWTAVSPMNMGRRGLALKAGRPTNTSRYLYAIGGDNGTNAGAMASVESVGVNVFGDLSTWRVERGSLPVAKTLAGVDRIGRFIYVVGGHDGTTATNTVYRAQVLDPLATPEVVDIDAALGDGTNGLGGGLFHYRISAIFDAADPSNPAGESLPGEVQVVDLPDLMEKIQLTLTWSAVPGAIGYRVYRTPNAGDSVDAVELLATVMGAANLSYADTGTTTTAAETPLPEGSLGNWHSGGTLNTNREATTAVAGVDPTNPNVYYLYVFGGRNETGTYLSSFEYATVTVAADGSQTISAWTTGAASLSNAKAEIGAYRVTSDQSSFVPAGQTMIYIGPGRTGAGFTGVLESFQVAAGGNVAAFINLNRNVSSSRSGYGFGTSSNFLYIFGGAGGDSSGDGISAELNGASTLRPGAWNSLGISMSDDRVFMSTTQESAFYFTAGGWDSNTNTALTSVDQTVQ